MRTSPVFNTAAEWTRPAATELTWSLMRLRTTTGSEATALSATPHWPSMFRPLQFSQPNERLFRAMTRSRGHLPGKHCHVLFTDCLESLLWCNLLQKLSEHERVSLWDAVTQQKPERCVGQRTLIGPQLISVQALNEFRKLCFTTLTHRSAAVTKPYW